MPGLVYLDSSELDDSQLRRDWITPATIVSDGEQDGLAECGAESNVVVLVLRSAVPDKKTNAALGLRAMLVL